METQHRSFLESELKSKNIGIHQLAGDASSRKYFRIVSGESSWVLMSWEPFKDDGQYPFLSVRDHFAKHNVHVPQVVAKAPHLGLVLLEDLGDLTLERKFWENQNQSLALPFYQQAMDELIKIHYPCTFDRQVETCTAFRIEFDTEKLLWEMNYGKEHLLMKLCGLNLTVNELKSLDECFTSICERLHKQPKFIAHRDYHSRNLMLKLGKMRVIDFQDARLGTIQYDIVSLLRDSYVNLSDEVATQLIQYYLDRRNELASSNRALPKLSVDEFTGIYELQTVQRTFKACGSFASFFNTRQDTRYLKYLVPTLQTVKKSLSGFPQYDAFFSILSDHGVFERVFESAT